MKARLALLFAPLLALNLHAKAHLMFHFAQSESYAELATFGSQAELASHIRFVAWSCNESPLHRAAELGRASLVRYLLTFCGNSYVDVVDSQGRHPLSLVAEQVIRTQTLSQLQRNAYSQTIYELLYAMAAQPNFNLRDRLFEDLLDKPVSYENPQTLAEVFQSHDFLRAELENNSDIILRENIRRRYGRIAAGAIVAFAVIFAAIPVANVLSLLNGKITGGILGRLGWRKTLA